MWINVSFHTLLLGQYKELSTLRKLLMALITHLGAINPLQEKREQHDDVSDDEWQKHGKDYENMAFLFVLCIYLKNFTVSSLHTILVKEV